MNKSNASNSILCIILLFILSKNAYSDVLSDSLSMYLTVKDTNVSFIIKNRNCDECFFEYFANKDYANMFSAISTEDWHSKLQKYRNILVGKAYKIGKDTSVINILMDSALAEISHEIAILPIALYFTKQKKRDYIIIILRWETEMNSRGYLTIGHIKGYIYDLKNKKETCYMSCM